MNEADLKAELSRAYELRFGESDKYRREVWKILLEDFFQPLIGADKSILDLGSGWGEFINQVAAKRRLAMDLNPASREHLAPDVEFLEQDSSIPWSLPDASLDVVFTSNFLEHLRTKEAVRDTLAQARRCLAPRGRIICLGPNAKYLAGQYWDFWDHHVALTESSLSEILALQGFEIERCVARFLPFTMSRRRERPLWLIRPYLRMPWLWWVVGRQFLVVGRVAK